MGEVKKSINVIITEDHVILRQGLRNLLEEDEEICVTGEAGNGVELLKLLSEGPADVVLMDISMPHMDGYAATEQVQKLYPQVKVVALSMLNNLSVIQKMLNCGAQGYLLKTTGKDELQSAIKLVAGGGNYICSEISLNMISGQGSMPVAKAEPKDEAVGLSKREIEVLALIAEGYTNAEIAEKLYASKRTIETHRQHILEKTGAKNTANLIKYAIENKIIKIEMTE